MSGSERPLDDLRAENARLWQENNRLRAEQGRGEEQRGQQEQWSHGHCAAGLRVATSRSGQRRLDGAN